VMCEPRATSNIIELIGKQSKKQRKKTHLLIQNAYRDKLVKASK
jgi:hypothetical protein